MSTRSSRCAAWLWSAAFVLAGCRGATCPAGTLPEPATLTASAGRNASLKSLRAEAVVDQQGPDGRIRGRVLMFMQRPDRVRFDAMSQFGPLAILTSDGEQFALSDLKDHRYVSGPACPANIARMLGVQLSAAEVLGLLLGELPLELPGAAETTCTGGLMEARHALPDGGALVVGFTADGPGGQVRLSTVKRLHAAGEAVWSVRYEGRVEDGEVSLPHIVELHDHRRDTELRVRFKKIEANVDVPDGVFRQSPRPGLAREEVACP